MHTRTLNHQIEHLMIFGILTDVVSSFALIRDSKFTQSPLVKSAVDTMTTASIEILVVTAYLMFGTRDQIVTEPSMAQDQSGVS